MPRYKTHARTIDELRSEFLSDIQRRLDHLDTTLKQMRPNAAEAGRITRTRLELLSLQEYWKEIELPGEKEQNGTRDV